jgi:hypothetical protein
MRVSYGSESQEDNFAYGISAGRVKFTGVTPGGGTLEERFALLLPPISLSLTSGSFSCHFLQILSSQAWCK